LSLASAASFLAAASFSSSCFLAFSMDATFFLSSTDSLGFDFSSSLAWAVAATIFF
jgi:hypothetical protein